MTARRHRLAQHRKALGFNQERFAAELGVDRSSVQRWEAGSTDPQPAIRPALGKLLRVSPAELQNLLYQPTDNTPHPSPDLVLAHHRPDTAETDDMNRRELLRLLNVSSVLLTIPSLPVEQDTGSTTDLGPDVGSIDDYERLNQHLWRVFALSPTKQCILPMVRDQLNVLVTTLAEPHTDTLHQRVRILTADLLQLCGEIFFDANHYTDAAHCYTLAASASKEAGAYDLWACALTRHAFIALYEHQHESAAALLGLATTLARRGDPTLSTRYWIAAVHAENAAAQGDLTTCQRALDTAEEVRDLHGRVHTGGWLRFDGSRLPEQRGTCYATVNRPDLAEEALTSALAGPLTNRRRAGVYTDLATIGAQRHDPDQVLHYTAAALDVAHQTASGVVASKLQGLRPRLTALLPDPRIQQLDTTIAALAR